MMKPEFSKQFNIEHAKAGAPYACRNGLRATILKWDCKNQYELVGVSGDNDNSTTWSASGEYVCGGLSDPIDLVMTALGYIDGKPVFVGDEFLGHEDTPCVAHPGMSSDYSGCRWPAPAKAYPETRMGKQDIKRAFHAANGETESGWRGIANAALRHAIDNGQVVPKDETTALHHIDTGAVVLREIYDVAMRDLERATRSLTRAGFVDNGAQYWKPPVNAKADELTAAIAGIESCDKQIEQLRTAVFRSTNRIAELTAERAERDMAVANAVRDFCAKYVDHRYPVASLATVDLVAIVATIK